MWKLSNACTPFTECPHCIGSYFNVCLHTSNNPLVRASIDLYSSPNIIWYVITGGCDVTETWRTNNLNSRDVFSMALSWLLHCEATTPSRYSYQHLITSARKPTLQSVFIQNESRVQSILKSQFWTTGYFRSAMRIESGQSLDKSPSAVAP